MREIAIVVSKNEKRMFANEAHFSTLLPVYIPSGTYKAQVFKVGEGAVMSLRILLFDESEPDRRQQSLF